MGETGYLIMALSGLLPMVLVVAAFMWRSKELQRKREAESAGTPERPRPDIANPS